MFNYAAAVEEKICQFTRYLKLMDRRAHEEVGGPCFIIFDERPPSQLADDELEESQEYAMLAEANGRTAYTFEPSAESDGEEHSDDPPNRFIQF